MLRYSSTDPKQKYKPGNILVISSLKGKLQTVKHAVRQTNNWQTHRAQHGVSLAAIMLFHLTQTVLL